MTEKNEKETAVFSFGVITDIQYADCEDGYDFSRTRKRYYRSSLEHTKKALNYWNSMNPGLKFIAQLGDIVDGKNKSQKTSMTALCKILEVLSDFPGPILHIWGNQELFNFSRQDLFNSPLSSSENKHVNPVSGKAYYSYEPHPSFLILVVDCYEISVLGYEKNSPNYIKAKEILRVNPNEDLNSPSNMPKNIVRFVAFNGGLDFPQLDWMENSLTKAERKKQNVIVMGHCPVSELCAYDFDICWSCHQLQDIMHKHSCVVAYFAGHSHDGGFAVDENGLSHLTFPAIIETAPNDDAFATVDVFQSRIKVHGHGKVPNFDISLKYPLNP